MVDYTLKKIEAKFWYRVKAYAALKGLSIKAFILKLLERELDGEK